MTKTIARLHRDATPHTGWCTRDHRCGVDLHQAPDLIADHIGARAVITRTRAGRVDYAEVRIRIPLHRNETVARTQLATILLLIRELLAAVVHRPTPLAARSRRSIGRDAA